MCNYITIPGKSISLLLEKGISSNKTLIFADTIQGCSEIYKKGVTYG
jgi:hypothetical protein